MDSVKGKAVSFSGEYAKRDEEKALLDAVGKSKQSYEEIMTFLTSNEGE